MKMTPEPEVLQDILRYEESTGDLIWRDRPAHYFTPTKRFSDQAQANIWNGKNAGKCAFSRINERGYKVGVVFGIPYLAHRIIWKMIKSEEPQTIDHINGDTSDNRLSNLRNTSALGNARNQSVYATNKTGVAGVSMTAHGKFKAQIGNHGKPEYLGCFDTIGEAQAARKEAEIRVGYHPNHGKERTGGEQ